MLITYTFTPKPSRTAKIIQGTQILLKPSQSTRKRLKPCVYLLKCIVCVQLRKLNIVIKVKIFLCAELLTEYDIVLLKFKLHYK